MPFVLLPSATLCVLSFVVDIYRESSVKNHRLKESNLPDYVYNNTFSSTSGK